MNIPQLPDDADTRFALAWLALYFMRIAGGLSGVSERLPAQIERLLNTASTPVR